MRPILKAILGVACSRVLALILQISLSMARGRSTARLTRLH